jgi:hypothetical protein
MLWSQEAGSRSREGVEKAKAEKLKAFAETFKR